MPLQSSVCPRPLVSLPCLFSQRQTSQPLVFPYPPPAPSPRRPTSSPSCHQSRARSPPSPRSLTTCQQARALISLSRLWPSPVRSGPWQPPSLNASRHWVVSGSLDLGHSHAQKKSNTNDTVTEGGFISLPGNATGVSASLSGLLSLINFINFLLGPVASILPGFATAAV